MNALAAKRSVPAAGFTRRGACPALSAPMQTGDGLLVRLNPVAGGLTPKALIGLCEASEAYGNGIIEVTARGSIQVRGLTEASSPVFARAVDALGIAVRTGVPVQTSVLAGLDPDEKTDPTPLAEQIRAAIAEAELESLLGPKVSVVVDGGGRSALEAVAADIRLTAINEGGNIGWRIAVARDARTAKSLGVAPDDGAACRAALSILSPIATQGREARARDLSDEKLINFAKQLQTERSMLSCSTQLAGNLAASTLLGIIKLRDSRFAVGVALPFGHATVGQLNTFAAKANALDIADIRPAPRRTLVAICAKVAEAKALRGAAESLGFITSPDDPRQAISACAGAPACASGHIVTREIAAEIGSENKSLLDGSWHLHVSGCAKGCAHPGDAVMTLVGGEAGTGIVVGGTARDKPLAYAPSDSARRSFGSIAKLIGAERRADETAAQAIERIGVAEIAAAFGRREK